MNHNIRVGAGVGHGEHERLVVGELEVLVGELLTVDGLATSALQYIVSCVQINLWMECPLTLPRVKSPP